MKWPFRRRHQPPEPRMPEGLLTLLRAESHAECGSSRPCVILTFTHPDLPAGDTVCIYVGNGYASIYLDTGGTPPPQNLRLPL